MPNVLKIVIIPASIFLVPLLLQTLYVSFMRGESVASSLLHWTYETVIVASAVPFIAMLRVSPVSRIILGILLLPVVAILALIAGLFVACVMFESCP